MTTSKILIASLALALAACARSEQDDVGSAAHDISQQGAEPAAKAAQRQAEARTADAHAAAGREINKTAIKQYKVQAKADYDIAIAHANGDLSAALAKCATQSGATKSSCEQAATTTHDQTVNAENAKLGDP
jgi:hypothetical protein